MPIVQGNNRTTIYQLKNKAYTAGIVVGWSGKVLDAAPIIKWMVGKNFPWVKRHCAKHHIEIIEVPYGQDK